MINNPIKPNRTGLKKTILLAIASVVLVGGIGYGTVVLLRQLKAPTISRNDTPAASVKTAAVVDPKEAQKIADDAKKIAIEKVAAGKQEDALKDYKVAYENYKIADNTASANDMKFAIESIEKVMAVPKNPGTPKGGVASAKQ